MQAIGMRSGVCPIMGKDIVYALLKDKGCRDRQQARVAPLYLSKYFIFADVV